LIPSALEEGIASLRKRGKKIKFLYLVPNYQNPAGVLLTAERRIEILEIARREGVFVVEDNPYGLLGFQGPSPAAMRAHDSENVIYHRERIIDPLSFELQSDGDLELSRTPTVARADCIFL